MHVSKSKGQLSILPKNPSIFNTIFDIGQFELRWNIFFPFIIFTKSGFYKNNEFCERELRVFRQVVPQKYASYVDVFPALVQ